MEKYRGAANHEHGAEDTGGNHRRFSVSGQHRVQPPSGQRVQRKEDHAAEQAYRKRCSIAPAHHGGGREPGGKHGHGRFQQQEHQTHPVRPLHQQPDKAGHREAEQSAAAAGEQQAHGVDTSQQRRGQTPPDAVRIFQQIQRRKQGQRKETGRYVGVVIQAVDTGGIIVQRHIGIIRAQGVHQSVERPEQHPGAAHIQRDEGNDRGDGRATPQQAGNVLPLKAGK